MIVESPDVIRIVMSAKHRRDPGFEVSLLRSVDAGQTWQKENTIVSSETVRYDIGAFVKDAHPNA